MSKITTPIPLAIPNYTLFYTKNHPGGIRAFALYTPIQKIIKKISRVFGVPSLAKLSDLIVDKSHLAANPLTYVWGTLPRCTTVTAGKLISGEQGSPKWLASGRPRTLHVILHDGLGKKRAFHYTVHDVSNPVKMATVTDVLSFLRILTSNAAPTQKKTEFDEVLLSKMERLKDALGKKGRLSTLEQRLESQINALHVRSKELSSDQTFCENTEIYENGSPDSKNEENDLGTGEANLTHRKDEIRWTFVETCLELLKLLKECLVTLVPDVKCSDQKDQQTTRKRGNQAPPLPADSLGVGDQKTVLTAIQFVVMLGICPNLISGVGLPVEKRSGFASVLNIGCSVKSERHLFECINTLVDCISQPSLGALVLSRHLGDILSGLLQICYAPVSAYLHDRSNKTELKSLNDNHSAINHSESLDNPSSENDVDSSKNPSSRTKVYSDSKSFASSDSSDQMQPSDVYMSTQRLVNRAENNNLFITSSKREICARNLQRILDRVYQPVVIRELLMLQGRPSNAQKKPAKNNSGKENLSGSDGKASSNQGMKHSVSPSQTPIWMRNVCGQLLSERLMKPNGVKAVLHALLEGSAGIKINAIMVKPIICVWEARWPNG